MALSTGNTLAARLHYLFGLERFGIKLGLEVMERLLAELGNPHQRYPSIHITGTNGKGSTASFIAAVLAATGRRVGLYTSPHLYRFNERVRVDGVAITDEHLGELIERVRRAAEAAGVQPTFFEFTTALAVVAFAEAQVEVAVVEAGMGGRLDATNVLVPQVAVITNVGLDHLGMIGNNRQEIAENKSGIVKRGRPLVTAERDETILAYFERVCLERGATLRVVGREFTITQEHASLEGQMARVCKRATGECSRFRICLLGRHQLENAGTALLVLDELSLQGWPISASAVQAGLAAAVWEGRLDIVSRRPLIVVDGAHNPEGVESLNAWLQETALPRAEVLIVAQKRGKDLGTLYHNIAPRFELVIATQGNYEPEPAEHVAMSLRRVHTHVQAISEVAAALAAGRARLSEDGMMLVTGSLYMVGDALVVLRGRGGP